MDERARAMGQIRALVTQGVQSSDDAARRIFEAIQKLLPDLDRALDQWEGDVARRAHELTAGLIDLPRSSIANSAF